MEPARPFSKRKDYTNWELSVDRANAARRIIEATGARPGQITQVRGFADQNLRNHDDPNDASNRRISVIVRYQNATTADAAPSEPAEQGKENGKAAEKAAPPDTRKAPDTEKKAEK